MARGPEAKVTTKSIEAGATKAWRVASLVHFQIIRFLRWQKCARLVAAAESGADRYIGEFQPSLRHNG
jgi:hypothetical protein